MEVFRPSILNEIELHVSIAKEHSEYMVHDKVTGRIYRVSQMFADAVDKLRDGIKEKKPPQEILSEDEFKAAYLVIKQVESGREADKKATSKFNPLFLSFKLFNVAPYQKYLKPIATKIFRPWFYITCGVMLTFCIWLGVQNEGAIFDSFQDIFSLQAITTFALISPFLKIFHEFGHVIIATHCNVIVRYFGITFIAMYPLPNVDCTHADLKASRYERMSVSLGGLISDLFMSMIIFILWHFSESSFVKTILGNAFVFNTLSTLLFNINPLMKLDGYYAITDYFGVRNLYMNSSKKYTYFKQYITSFSTLGEKPRDKYDVMQIVYAFLSSLYKLNILITVAWGVLPRYFGVGALMVVWAAFAMFVSPFLAERPQLAETEEQVSKMATYKFRRKIFFAGIFIILGLIAFIPMRFKVLIPMQLDVENFYAVNSPLQGFVAKWNKTGETNKNEPLVILENEDVDFIAKIKSLKVDIAKLTYENVKGLSASEAQNAQEQLDAAQKQLELSLKQKDDLVIKSKISGYFIPDKTIKKGDFLKEGQKIGILLSKDENSVLVGNFPENYVDKFKSGLQEISFKRLSTYETLKQLDTVKLHEIIDQDSSTGERTFQLLLQIPGDAAELNNQNFMALIIMDEEPLYEHVMFWLQTLYQRFKEAQISEIKDRFLQ